MIFAETTNKIYYMEWQRRFLCFFPLLISFFGNNTLPECQQKNNTLEFCQLLDFSRMYPCILKTSSGLYTENLICRRDLHLWRLGYFFILGDTAIVVDMNGHPRVSNNHNVLPVGHCPIGWDQYLKVSTRRKSTKLQQPNGGDKVWRLPCSQTIGLRLTIICWSRKLV